MFSPDGIRIRVGTSKPAIVVQLNASSSTFCVELGGGGGGASGTVMAAHDRVLA